VEESRKRLVTDDIVHAERSENSIERFGQVNKDYGCTNTMSMRLTKVRSDLVQTIGNRHAALSSHLLLLKELLKDVRLAGADCTMYGLADLTRDQ
jgi:hypothetical protein